VCTTEVFAPCVSHDSNPNTAACFWELEYEDDPPCVYQHHQSTHAHKQTISSACLLIAYTPIFHGSVEFFSDSFHINVIAFLTIHDEQKVKMSQSKDHLLRKLKDSLSRVFLCRGERTCARKGICACGRSWRRWRHALAGNKKTLFQESSSVGARGFEPPNS
jgi:hypothetical protein